MLQETHRKNTSIKLPELLAPAGNFEKFRTALLYGADAIYMGSENLNLRASADGVSFSQLKTAVLEAEAKKAKIYYCLNALPMEKHLKNIPSEIEQAALAGVHGFIIADPGVLRLAKKYAPQIEIHLSTQANTTNSESINFWKEQGVSRVNLARELSCSDIYRLRKKCPDTELEVFVHGAMCLAVSGQCLLSAWLNNRPANLGRCTHPCRFEYKTLEAKPKTQCDSCDGDLYPETELSVSERKRPNERVWTIDQDRDYARFWSPQDLCLLPYLPWFVKNKIDSIKIEGRMKSSAYVAYVVNVYRAALNQLSTLTQNNSLNLFDSSAYLQELFSTATRPLGSGFFIPNMRLNFNETEPGTENAHNTNTKGQRLLARILDLDQQKFAEAAKEKGDWNIEIKGTWDSSLPAELMLPNFKKVILEPNSYSLENTRGEKISVLHSGVRARLKANNPELIAGIFIRSTL
ncbi:peptidase U32 family protein [Desulfovibrio litoralis]|uniref:peptidase U32 family protein n=1 Tax=Desulfovibrio litoralis TaxID=466107 RepID=UPI0015B9816B|nr:peptidase U32 family protein [Desulfovibrio litoralis]